MNMKKTNFTVAISPHQARTADMQRVVTDVIAQHFDTRVGVDIRQKDDRTLDVTVVSLTGKQ